MSKPILFSLAALCIVALLISFLPAPESPQPPTASAEPARRGVQETDASETDLRSSGDPDKGAAEGNNIFAGGTVHCRNCGDTGQRLELRHLTDTPSKIALILESFRDQNSLSGCDPRIAQLVALGDGAVNDLLEAFDAVNAEGAADKGYRGGAARFALEGALEQLLKAKDKEIILTYFEQRASFTSLVRKYRFPEAGEIALRRLQAPAMWLESSNADGSTTYRSSFSSSADPAIAAALSPSNAIPWMLQEMQTKRFVAGRYLPALAEHAPHVDIRPQMAEFFASEHELHEYTASQLAPFALARGVPEGLDAVVRVLRNFEFSYAHGKLLDSVRKHVGFDGTPDETADWIEQNRQRLFWSEGKKRFVFP